jgi:hypothetical protein
MRPRRRPCPRVSARAPQQLGLGATCRLGPAADAQRLPAAPLTPAHLPPAPARPPAGPQAVIGPLQYGRHAAQTRQPLRRSSVGESPALLEQMMSGDRPLDAQQYAKLQALLRSAGITQPGHSQQQANSWGSTNGAGVLGAAAEAEASYAGQGQQGYAAAPAQQQQQQQQAQQQQVYAQQQQQQVVYAPPQQQQQQQQPPSFVYGPQYL